MKRITTEEVLCIAAGQTYDIVIRTGITAHPAVAPYPRLEPTYLAPIKKGGSIEYLYLVKNIIECLPEDVYIYKNQLAENDYRALISYHESRRDTFGYSRNETKYRFYVLGTKEILKKPYIKKGIQVSVRIDLADIWG